MLGDPAVNLVGRGGCAKAPIMLPLPLSGRPVGAELMGFSTDAIGPEILFVVEVEWIVEAEEKEVDVVVQMVDVVVMV